MVPVPDCLVIVTSEPPLVRLLPNWSLAWTVRTWVELPLATIDELVGVRVDWVASAGPGVKVTDPPVLETGVTIGSCSASAVIDFKVHVETPEGFVTEHAPYTFVLPVSVAENVGVTPETPVLVLSLIVIVMVDVAMPLATTGLVPTIEEFVALNAVTTTVPVVVPF